MASANFRLGACMVSLISSKRVASGVFHNGEYQSLLWLRY